MKSITYDELKRMVAANGELEGWDFSRLRTGREPVPWDYGEVVRRYLKSSDRVLDIGTGGGEIFFSLADSFHNGVAIDAELSMIATAQRNQAARSIQHCSLAIMDGSDLAFKSSAFDVVLLRHLHVYAEQIVRVLRPGGIFITQMVGQHSSLNILKAFGWTPDSFGPGWWQPVAELAQQFRGLGCRVLKEADYDVACWYLDQESFLFWLLAVPWPEEIVLEKHWRTIKRLLETCQTERGIETNEHIR